MPATESVTATSESATSETAASVTEAHADVVVLGAGPTGLAAARALARRGVAVTVLEAGQAVGGMAASIEVGGQRVDLGSHRLHPAMARRERALVDALLGADLQERPRRGRMAVAGRLVAFPPDPLDLLRTLPPSVAAPFVRDALTAPQRRRAAAAQGLRASPSFADAVRVGLGPQALERFYGPYARKLWGVGPDELDADLARRRVTANSGGAIARRLARQLRGPATFLYPRLGFGQLVERLADDAVRAGVSIELGTPARSVVPAPPLADADADDGGGVRVEAMATAWRARAVVSTIPLPVLARLVPGAPPAVRAAVDALEVRAMALVYLVLDRPHYTAYDAHYLPGPETIVSRLSEPKRYRDGPDPADRTVLCAEVPCTAGDGTWSLPDDVLAGRVADELAGVGLPLVRAVDAHVVRLGSVYPVERLGTPAHRAVVEAWLDGVPGVLSTGRQGLLVPDNTHHALSMGIDAAAALDDDLRIDAGRWAQARRAVDHHVVED